MSETNSTILTHAWLSATNDFQQRIPEPTQSNINAVIDALLDPMNKQYYNQFIDILVMRIGDTFVHQQTFRNPLRVFKKSQMRYGSTLQEIIPKWIRAHAYEDDAEDVFKMARPDVAQWFHSQNRRDRYDITINRDELRTAFTTEGGLNRLVASILDVPMNSDEYDEYRIMMQLMAVYEQKWGFYKEQISAVTSEATGKAFLKKVRAYAGKLQFPNTIYNNGAIPDVPIFVKPSELVLFITPDVQASIDVDTLASLFHLEKADITYRTILVDEFPIDGAVALLTTEDFFMCRDTEYTTTSMYNPKTLGQNYFLHHWGVYSVSPFVPAILFTTESGTSVGTITQELTALSIALSDSTPAPGDLVTITPTLTGTLKTASNASYTGTAIELAPTACTYAVSVARTTGSGQSAVTSAVNSPRTYVDTEGVLHVGSELHGGDVITIVATSTYINPSGDTSTLTDDATATVTV